MGLALPARRHAQAFVAASLRVASSRFLEVSQGRYIKLNAYLLLITQCQIKLIPRAAQAVRTSPASSELQDWS